MRKALLAAVTLAMLAACAPRVPDFSQWRPRIPRVHKITIQQGNLITQEMIDRLKPGMSRSQVIFVMGEPVVRNTFDEDRWDYIYRLNVPNVLQQESRLSLFFHDDVLAYFTGDYVPTSASGEVPAGTEDAEEETEAEEAES